MGEIRCGGNSVKSNTRMSILIKRTTVHIPVVMVTDKPPKCFITQVFYHITKESYLPRYIGILATKN